MRGEAELEDGQPEIGVLADRVARPVAGRHQRRTADQAHGAMRDDGVLLVPLHHADVEEAGIFAVHGVMHGAACAVAMVLRRLDHADLGIGEHRHQVFEPVRVHDVVGIEHADDLGVGRGVGQRQTKRAGLEAQEIVLAHELEALAERLAVLLDRTPQRRVGRVVDDDDALEVRIFEPRHRIERQLEHLRRLLVGRNVDRDLRRERQLRHERRRHDQAARLAAEGDVGDLLDALHRDEDQRDQQHERERVGDRRAGHEIVPVPIGEQDRKPRAGGVGRGRKQRGLAGGDAGERQDRQRQQHAEQHRDPSQASSDRDW